MNRYSIALAVCFVSILPCAASAFPGPVGTGEACAFYDPVTGEIVISYNGINNWYIESATDSLTGASPAGLPLLGGLITDNDTRIGESSFLLGTVTDHDLGPVAAPGLSAADLTLTWTAGLGGAIQQINFAEKIPEPTAIALTAIGLLTFCTYRRKRTEY